MFHGSEPMKKLSKIELIKECQRLVLLNDCSIFSAKIIGEFMKKNLESNEEWYQKNKDKIPEIMNSIGISEDKLIKCGRIK